MLGLLPEVFWSLTWPDYESLLYNHRYREQQALAGSRAVATQLYNLAQGFAKHPKAKTQAEYWSLPMLDQQVTPPPPPPESWWDKMKGYAHQSGYKFPTD